MAKKVTTGMRRSSVYMAQRHQAMSDSSSVTTSSPPPSSSEQQLQFISAKRRRKARTQAERDAAKEERADRNRKAAQASRDRKRRQAEEMEETLDSLTSRNVHLETENTQLNQRVQMLEEDHLTKNTEMLQLQSDLLMLRDLVTAMQKQQQQPIQPQHQQHPSQTQTVSTNHHSARMMDQQCLVEMCARTTTRAVMVLLHIMTTVLLHRLWRTWACLLISRCAKEGKHKLNYPLWTNLRRQQQTPATVFSLEMARLMDYCLAVDLATTFGKETASGLLRPQDTRQLMCGDYDATKDGYMDMDVRDL